jgi:hypothetical protein
MVPPSLARPSAIGSPTSGRVTGNSGVPMIKPVDELDVVLPHAASIEGPIMIPPVVAKSVLRKSRLSMRVT